ncbi:hypothetical protein JOD97_003856 [Duganella sp. 1411]|uniref:hypothetical protein n=1 Tax=Duganella sp. 1411 TaxID=2806572 RepID=UPI001AE92757|nr:hypothetical protein [Duganella sp. 1411]MBP1205794.1 hypothetical protein [Duganella sp. 1411]
MHEFEPHHNLDLDAAAAKESAAKLNAFRNRLIQERWLSTLILSIHLELEAMMEALIREAKLKLGKRASSRDATFFAKVSQCEVLTLLDIKVISCLRAVNKLRNELAHNLDNKPSSESVFRFIESMSAMHPLSVSDGTNQPARSLGTFNSIREHFTGTEAENLEELVFVSLMMLRVTLLRTLDESRG